VVVEVAVAVDAAGE